jgi:hypothetical protein
MTGNGLRGGNRKGEMQIRVIQMVTFLIAVLNSALVFTTFIGTQQILGVGNGHGKRAGALWPYKQLGMRYPARISTRGEVVFQVIQPQDLRKVHDLKDSLLKEDN